MGDTQPSASGGKPSGFFALEEKIAAQMEAMAGELESRIAEGESMLVRLRQAERSGSPFPGFSSPSDSETRDPLTGLYGRVEITRRLAEEKSRADRTVRRGMPGFAVLAIDITGFREINSTYGMAVGDYLLGRFGQFIKASMRNYDVVGRFSGDEFMALLPGASKSQAIRIAKAAIEKLALWRDFRSELAGILGRSEEEYRDLELSCSVGISDYLSEGKDSATGVDAVVSRAEYALYRARRQGKRRYAVWGQTKEKGDE